MPPKTEPAASLGWDQVLALRLERHHLASRTTPDRLVDVARELVGIHAQVMSGAELQLAARIDGLRPDDVRDALWERRRLVKAWAMRGTLHLLAPEDLVAFYRTAGWITPLVIVDGRVGGTWEIGGGKKGVVEVVPFGRWRGGVRQELAEEVDRVAAFLDRPLKPEIAASSQ